MSENLSFNYHSFERHRPKNSGEYKRATFRTPSTQFPIVIVQTSSSSMRVVLILLVALIAVVCAGTSRRSSSPGKEISSSD